MRTRVLGAYHADLSQILSDEDKRILYDTGGEKAVQEATANENAPASPFGTFA